MSKISAGAITWALIGVEVIAVGVGAWLGPEAGVYVALAGLLLFIPLAKELIGNRSANASQLLGFVHDEGKPYLQENKNNPLQFGPFLIQGTLYTYRIGIANRGNSTINDVEVKLTGIKDCPATFNAIGGHLHWMHDNPPDGQPRLTKKSIPPTRQLDFSDAVFIDVFLCFWPDSPEHASHKHLQICHIVPGISVIVPFRSYELIVTANDQDQAIVPTTLRFDVSGEQVPRLTLIK
jgi:hypothetical protein